MTDFLDVKRREITDRLKELAPLVDEYRRLEAAASALDGVGASSTSSATTAAPRRRGPGRPRGSVNRTRKVTRKATRKATAATSTPSATAAATTDSPARKKPGRPPGRKKPGRPPGRKAPGRPPGRKAARVGRRKGSGTRAAQALSFVQGQPGITIPELAAKMGIKQNYLYRVLPGLEQEGKLEKKGRGWHPKG
ncbi:MAG TPA: hypothetical protein VFC30_04560 [Solirubrobacteraceae bacterium]|nr:hypothetical protein [Solirubrobacteraceae bacterium]